MVLEQSVEPSPAHQGREGVHIAGIDQDRPGPSAADRTTGSPNAPMTAAVPVSINQAPGQLCRTPAMRVIPSGGESKIIDSSFPPFAINDCRYSNRTSLLPLPAGSHGPGRQWRPHPAAQPQIAPVRAQAGRIDICQLDDRRAHGSIVTKLDPHRLDTSQIVVQRSRGGRRAGNGKASGQVRLDRVARRSPPITVPVRWTGARASVAARIRFPTICVWDGRTSLQRFSNGTFGS
ncbi:MAG: hypothetical protein M9947_00885 [Thermomicrobiales bacterium]|nr:hypothetical protein [Thermomicrobiales bacterium]